MTSTQIPFLLQLDPAHQFANFYAEHCPRLVQRLGQLAHQREAFELLILQGQSGCGKSHLLQACCQDVEDANGSALYLNLDELASFLSGSDASDAAAGMLDFADDYQLICIDDLQVLAELAPAHKRSLEEQLFGLLNRKMLSANASVICASSEPLAGLNIALADLYSRLTLASTLELPAIGDREREAILQFKSARRGLQMPVEVASFLLKRLPRDLHTLNAAIEQLDQFSLAQQRRLTIPMVKQALKL